MSSAPVSNSSKVWFIVSCSGGFGASLAEEVLSRGDKVIAGARDTAKLERLKVAGADAMQIDVTASMDELRKVAQRAYSMYGRIDYLINNAGYVLQGTIEELSPEAIQAQFNTNLFGLLNVTRSFLPYMRAARSGVIGNFSSLGAWNGYAGFGAYSASKWAVSGASESMTYELADFGIKVCCIEPGFFRSNTLNPGKRKVDEASIDDYKGTAARKLVEAMNSVDNNQPGDPKKGAKVIVDVLSGQEVPLRLVLGPDGYSSIKSKCEDTLKVLEQWKDVSTCTDHDDVGKQSTGLLSRCD